MHDTLFRPWLLPSHFLCRRQLDALRLEWRNFGSTCCVHRFNRFHAPTVSFAMCLASLFAKNAKPGMFGATNTSLIVDDWNDVASLALNSVSSQLLSFSSPGVVTTRDIALNPHASFNWYMCRGSGSSVTTSSPLSCKSMTACSGLSHVCHRSQAARE